MRTTQFQCVAAETQCTIKPRPKHSEVSMEDVAGGTSKKPSSPQQMIRKLVTAWNASTPLSGEAKTRQPLNFNLLQLKHNEQHIQANIVK
jgi:hypothetical protein